MLVIGVLIILIVLFSVLIFVNTEHFSIDEQNQTNDTLFLVISTKITSNMYRKYSEVIPNNLVFISDNTPDITTSNIYTYPNDLMKQKGFSNLHSRIAITSWDKAIYHLSLHKQNYKYFWIIEDDTYINKTTFPNFINSYKSNQADLLLFGWYKEQTKGTWFHWHIKENQRYFKLQNRKGSINQFVRISDKLLKYVLQFRRRHGKFCFHELLLASLVSEKKLKHEIINHDKVHLSALATHDTNSTKNNFIAYHPYKQWYDE